MLVARVIEFVVKVSQNVVDSVGGARRYDPSKHYMRGPGLKTTEAARRAATNGH